jgi:hypothetical protein
LELGIEAASLSSFSDSQEISIMNMFTGASPALRQYLLSIARRRLRLQQRWSSNVGNQTSNTIITPGAGTATAEAVINGTTKKQSRFKRIVSEMKKKP